MSYNSEEILTGMFRYISVQIKNNTPRFPQNYSSGKERKGKETSGDKQTK